jgi:DMSO/TMAO reductase YedYZ molybdopterin-dependent catalytic subunit
LAAHVIVRREPYNAEAPLAALGEVPTPVGTFYVRCNFSMPRVDVRRWRLSVDGALERPLGLSLADLRALPARTLAATLECAGNGRTGFAPLPKGEPWELGAVSTGVWRGAPLREVLAPAGLDSGAVEVLFEGADHGAIESGDDVRFARSLPRDKALHPDTLLAYEMNGEPLPAQHGGPVRLLVPGWYGMASVKWLARVTALAEPFRGHFQAERYVLDLPGALEKAPLREMRPRSLITGPAGGVLSPGVHKVRGVAWSGVAPVSRVEVSVEGGGEWLPALFLDEAQPYTWRRWELEWQVRRPGRHVLRSRAIDAEGNIQPEAAPWNRLGYANNAVQSVVVEVRE